MIVNSSVLLTLFGCCYCCLSDAALNWLLGCLFGGGHFNGLSIIELNSQNCMSDGANLVVAEVDLFYNASCSRRDLCNKFVSEYFAKVFVLVRV